MVLVGKTSRPREKEKRRRGGREGKREGREGGKNGGGPTPPSKGKKKLANAFSNAFLLSRALSLSPFPPSIQFTNTSTAQTHQHAAPTLGLPELQAPVLPRRGERAPVGRRRRGDDGRGRPVDEAGAVEGDHAHVRIVSMLLVLLLLCSSSGRRRMMSQRGSSGRSSSSSSSSSASRHLNSRENVGGPTRIEKEAKFSLSRLFSHDSSGLTCATFALRVSSLERGRAEGERGEARPRESAKRSEE